MGVLCISMVLGPVERPMKASRDWGDMQDIIKQVEIGETCSTWSDNRFWIGYARLLAEEHLKPFFSAFPLLSPRML
ncbi:hypothetical protein GOP47_0015238 [Adiantum capillus-veneris]|uniref:Uncharacterized protein n=1 Tax=Adiantum capillus-veneris TaxID=13818 RepID=A0A9D4UK11_ADICA|nr:hypothetical protein GOP47_0015238 [Adiantum capillus-veneris]